jgi:hypothetical protein
MKSIPSLAESVRAAEARVAEFAGLYRVVLFAEAAVALALLIVPGWTAELFGLPEALDSTIPGAFLLWAVAFQVPGLLNPVHSRLAVVIGIAGRYGVGIALLTEELWLFAAMTFAFAQALTVVYHRMARTVLMSRP